MRSQFRRVFSTFACLYLLVVAARCKGRHKTSCLAPFSSTPTASEEKPDAVIDSDRSVPAASPPPAKALGPSVDAGPDDDGGGPVFTPGTEDRTAPSSVHAEQFYAALRAAGMPVYRPAQMGICALEHPEGCSYAADKESGSGVAFCEFMNAEDAKVGVREMRGNPRARVWVRGNMVASVSMGPAYVGGVSPAQAVVIERVFRGIHFK